MTTPTTWPTCRGPTRASSRDRMSPPAKLGEGGSASSPRLENRPPPRLRRYSPTSGGRNPYGPHVWRTDPLPGYAGTPPQVGEKSIRPPRLENPPPPRPPRNSPTRGGENPTAHPPRQPRPPPATPGLPTKGGRN